MSINIYIFLVFFIAPIILPSSKAAIYSTIAMFMICIAWFLLSAFSGLAMSISGYVFPFFYLAGMIAGGVVRFLSNRFAKPREKPIWFGGISVLIFILSVILVSGPAKTYQWATDKSLNQCRASTFPVTIGKQKLNLSGKLLAHDLPAAGLGISFSIDKHDYKEAMMPFQRWCTEMLNRNITANDVKLTIGFRNEGYPSERDPYDCSIHKNGQTVNVCNIYKAWVKYESVGHMSAVIYSPSWDYPESRTSVVGHKPKNYPAIFETAYALNCSPNSVDTQCEAYGTLDSGLFYIIDFRARQGEQVAEGLRNLNAIKDVMSKLAETK